MAPLHTLPSIIPLPLDDDILNDIVRKAKDWALMHGAGMRSKLNFSEDSLQVAPFCLLPSALPMSEFSKSLKAQLVVNKLIHRVAHSPEFLAECLKDTVENDNFTAELYKIYQTVQAEGFTQTVSLGIIRSDLMLEECCAMSNAKSSTYGWKQVEINTIASGFGWLGPISSAIQRYVLQELGYGSLVSKLPDNHALKGLCDGMIDAWKLYNDPVAVILFVIEDVTYNICDQRFHEFEIRENYPSVRVIRRTLTQISEKGQLDENKQLLIDGFVVAVVYFRSGYAPVQYPTKAEWDARLLIERSLAIKCPSIQYHLAGTKKVQQTLAKPGVLQQLLHDPKDIELANEIFAGLYSLDLDEAGERAVQMALDDPHKFVLKPQREGGGNNVYGDDVRTTLLQMHNSKERTAWILMERLNPPISKGYIVRAHDTGLPPLLDLVSELGIFGVIIGDSENILVNQQAGHMLRTKENGANEGGVVSGTGSLDSPFLFD